MIPRSEQCKDQLAILAALFVALLLSFNFDVFNRWDQVIYDEFNTNVSNLNNDQIVVIAIDEKSLNKLGPWPWSRQMHAALLYRLQSANIRAIGFDLLFTEPDSRDPQGDRFFAQALSDMDKVVLPVLHHSSLHGINQLTVSKPVQALLNGKPVLGHIDAEVDNDGLIRSVFLKAGYESASYDALGLAVLKTAGIHLADLPGIRAPDLKQPASDQWIRDYQIQLPFSRSATEFNTLSYSDVLDPAYSLSFLNDKIIFVGITAPGLSAELPTPISSTHVSMSSINYHALVGSTLLNNKHITPISNSFYYLICASLLICSLLLMTKNRAGWAVFYAIACIVGSVLVAYALFNYYQLWFAPMSIVVVQALGFMIWSWRRMNHILRQLSGQKQRAETTLKSIADGVISLDKQHRILYVNTAAEAMTGCKLSEVKGRQIEQVFLISEIENSRHCDSSLNLLLTNTEFLESAQNLFLTNLHSHERFIIRLTIGKMWDDNGEDDGFVLAFNDMTETARMIEQMAHQATHDTLTNLPNRGLLMDRLNHAIAQAHRQNMQIAVMFIDIDKFKNINDSLGHAAGDMLLKKIANRFLQCVREEDTVARLGGDEFVIVFDKLKTSEMAFSVANKIISSLNKPFSIRENSLSVTCSIGISAFPKDSSDPEKLIKQADIAMYRAKDLGRNNFQFFSEDMHKIVQDKLLLERALRDALKNDQLSLHYQPQFSLDKKEIIGVEALLRWNHATLGPISPDKFIPLAEESGLIIPLGEWVLKTACQQAVKWQTALKKKVTMAVNLSPRQFVGYDVFGMLKDTLNQTQLDPKQLKLEITEGLFLRDKNNAVEILKKFRQLGGTVSIDDFGTGYSSLSYLSHIPVDQVKIDRTFIDDITRIKNGSAITAAIITMAQGLDLDVIAEGVENRTQLNILHSQNCRNIQGYFFSPAISADKMTEILQQDDEFYQAAFAT